MAWMVGLVGHHVASAVVVTIAAHTLTPLQRRVGGACVLGCAVRGRMWARVWRCVGTISTASAARGIAVMGPTGRMMRTTR